MSLGHIPARRLADSRQRWSGDAIEDAAGVESTTELSSFRRFQRQPAQRQVATVDQLRRFLGTRSTRKIRLAAALAQAVPLGSFPRPLVEMLKRSVDSSAR